MRTDRRRHPHLQPEVARTWSIGVTLNPEALPGFYATIDYYHIAISGEISTVPANYLFDQCLDNGTPQDCSQVVRTGTGALHGATVASGGYIIQSNVNAGASLVSGIDVRFELPLRAARRLGFITDDLQRHLGAT